MVLPVILSAMLFLSTAVKIQFNLQLKNPRYKERLHLLLKTCILPFILIASEYNTDT